MDPNRCFMKSFNIKYPRNINKRKTGRRPSPPHHPIIFKFDTVQRQQLCFPSPLLLYVLESANAAFLLKLQTTCKFLYAIKPIHICKNIFVNTKTEFRIYPESIYLPSDDKSRRLKKIYLTHQLACYDESFQVSDESILKKINRKFVSSLIPQLHKCAVESLCIPHQDLTMKEFEFLISSGKVKELDMQDTVVFDESGKKVPHDRIQMALYKHRCQLTGLTRFCGKIFEIWWSRSDCLLLLLEISTRAEFKKDLTWEPIHLCKNIYANTLTEFRIVQNSIYLPSFNPKTYQLKNVYLTHQLACFDENVFEMDEEIMKKINRKFVSSLIPQLYKCDVEYLYIPHQDLSMKEFEFLISSGKVNRINMQDTVVYDENGKKLPHVRIQMALYKHRCQLKSGSQFW